MLLEKQCHFPKKGVSRSHKSVRHLAIEIVHVGRTIQANTAPILVSFADADKFFSLHLRYYFLSSRKLYVKIPKICEFRRRFPLLR